MINGYWEALTFTVQEGEAQRWNRVVDTSLDTPRDFPDGSGEPLPSLRYSVGPRSVVVLVRSRARG
jgi:hypothetical protein